MRNVTIRTISYWLVAFVVVAGSVVGVASLTTLNEVNAARAAWDSYDTGAARKSRIMSDIRDAFGFGGLIHSFKNTVIRRDESDVQSAREKAKAAEQAVAEYRKQDLHSGRDQGDRHHRRSRSRPTRRRYPELETLIQTRRHRRGDRSRRRRQR